jgi:hypothetical protein
MVECDFQWWGAAMQVDALLKQEFWQHEWVAFQKRLLEHVSAFGGSRGWSLVASRVDVSKGNRWLDG